MELLKNIFGIGLLVVFAIGVFGLLGRAIGVFDPYERPLKITKYFFFIGVFVIVGFLAYTIHTVETSPVILP